MELGEVRRRTVRTGGITKSPLENPHPWKPEILSKFRDLRRHGAEVFRQKRKWSDVRLQCGEKFATRSTTPSASASVWGIAGNLKGLNEPDEVVDSNQIESIKSGADAPPPPGESFTPVI